MNANLHKCDKCFRFLIAEEVDSHICTNPTELWVIDGKVWIGDGKNWYPLTTQDSTPDRDTQGFNRTKILVLFNLQVLFSVVEFPLAKYGINF